MVDVSYGGENGFNQAIELSAEVLANVKFIKEKKLISAYFEQISQDTGRYCFGVVDTMKALEMGAVETVCDWPSVPRPFRVLIACVHTARWLLTTTTPSPLYNQHTTTTPPPLSS